MKLALGQHKVFTMIGLLETTDSVVMPLNIHNGIDFISHLHISKSIYNLKKKNSLAGKKLAGNDLS